MTAGDETGDTWRDPWVFPDPAGDGWHMLITARAAAGPVRLGLTVKCPRCHSLNTRELTRFGSTACKALHVCNECLEPFDYFKVH